MDDAIRAILKDGGNGDAEWSIERVIRVGDKATGTTALSDLYKEIGQQRGDIHLDSLWQSLGIVHRYDTIHFDDSAPWAAIRASITAPDAALICLHGRSYSPGMNSKSNKRNSGWRLCGAGMAMARWAGGVAAGGGRRRVPGDPGQRIARGDRA